MMDFPDISKYPQEAYPHLLPDVLLGSEWRSWRRLFLISTIKAFQDFYSGKNTVGIISPRSFLYNLLDKPSYSGKIKTVYLYIVRVEGEFDWNYLVPIDNPIPSKPWAKWRTATGKKYLSFYKYGITRYPNIISRDKTNYKDIIDWAEVPIEIASWAEHALAARLDIRFPKSSYSVGTGNKKDGTLEGLSKSFVGYSEAFNFRKNPKLLEGLCKSTVKRIDEIYNIGGDEALTVYSYSASWLESSLQRLIHKKLLRLSEEYANRCGFNAGRPMPLEIEDELHWAFVTHSHQCFHDVCFPFIQKKARELRLERLFSVDFLMQLDAVARAGGFPRGGA